MTAFDAFQQELFSVSPVAGSSTTEGTEAWQHEK